MRRSGEGEDASAGSKVGVVDPGRNLKVPSRSQPEPGITVDKGNETETETG